MDERVGLKAVLSLVGRAGFILGWISLALYGAIFVVMTLFLFVALIVSLAQH